jgi:hypothetical protein
MKKETDVECAACKAKKVRPRTACFSVKVSRLEEYLNHRVYECDHCHKRYKFIDQPGGRT